MDIKKYEIDSETGLPTLPEGYRWFVQAQGVSLADSKGLWVSVESLTKLPKWDTVRNPDYRWWHEFTHAQPEFISVDGEEWREVHGLSRPTKGFTAQHVLDAAFDLYESFEETLVKHGALKNLVGAYPPKKLEV